MMTNDVNQNQTGAPKEEPQVNNPNTKDAPYLFDWKMSFFLPPISPYHDGNGNFHPATLTPYATLTLEQVYCLIVQDPHLEETTKRVRSWLNQTDPRTSCFRRDKQRYLPYVTPAGVVSRRSSEAMERLSGVFVIDIDGVKGGIGEAERLRDMVHADPHLQSRLTFVSPSGHGVKLFVPVNFDWQWVGYRRHGGEPDWMPSFEHRARIDYALSVCMSYLKVMLSDAWKEFEGAHVDGSGKDLARACFLCHDPGAQMR